MKPIRTGPGCIYRGQVELMDNSTNIWDPSLKDVSAPPFKVSKDVKDHQLFKKPNSWAEYTPSQETNRKEIKQSQSPKAFCNIILHIPTAKTNFSVQNSTFVPYIQLTKLFELIYAKRDLFFFFNFYFCLLSIYVKGMVKSVETVEVGYLKPARNVIL